jgi:hypothetical protein
LVRLGGFEGRLLLIASPSTFCFEGFLMLFVRLGGFEGFGDFVSPSTFCFEEGFLMLFVRLGGFEGFGDFVWVLLGRLGILEMFLGRSI